MVASNGQPIWKKQLLIPNVDVVCIALPNNVHADAVMLCCKHKKAVVTNKTISTYCRGSITNDESGRRSGHLSWLS
jgi:hypothetical protein